MSRGDSAANSASDSAANSASDSAANSAFTRFDVIVVGGGPAGSIAACDLARRGLNVVVFERKRFPRPKVCGAFVSPEAWSDLEAVGLDSLVRQAGAVEIRAGALISRDGTRLDIPFPSCSRT